VLRCGRYSSIDFLYIYIFKGDFRIFLFLLDGADICTFKESGDSPQCETKYEEKCETKYDTVQEQKCETVYDNKCNTVQEQKCETRYEDKCETKGGQSHRFPSIFRTLAYKKNPRVNNHWKVSTSI
jgi:hypothetical protein